MKRIEHDGNGFEQEIINRLERLDKLMCTMEGRSDQLRLLIDKCSEVNRILSEKFSIGEQDGIAEQKSPLNDREKLCLFTPVRKIQHHGTEKDFTPESAETHEASLPENQLEIWARPYSLKKEKKENIQKEKKELPEILDTGELLPPDGGVCVESCGTEIKGLAPSEYHPLFEGFWTHYPRRNGKRGGKRKAFVTWWKLVRDGIVESHYLVERIQVLASTYGDFSPDAVTWLNGHRWEDEAYPGEHDAPDESESPYDMF